MANIWNESNLQQPPLITVPVRNSKLPITNLRKILDDAINFYGNQQSFEEAAALCSRLIARRKNSFRRMPGFKNLCKLNSALCRILRIDIKSILENFHGTLPEYISEVTVTHLPSVSCLEYLLIRLISLHKILERVTDCTETSAKYFIQLLSHCFFQDIIVLLLAVLSQIWKLGQIIANQTAKYYGELLKYKSFLPKSKKPWLSESIQLPEQLETIQKMSPSQQQNDDSGSSISKTQINFSSELSTQIPNKSTKRTASEKFNILHENIDVGTIISRDSLTSSTKVSKNIQLQSITTADEIRNFFADEDKQRRQSIKKSTTRKISNGEWIAIKKTINNRIIANDTKKALKLFRSFIKNKLHE